MEVKLINIKNGNLTNIDMTCNSNAITGILGNCDSGKTDLLEIIDLLEAPESGQILFDGNAYIKKKKNEIRKKIGFVFQNPEEQFFSTTVEKELEVALELFKDKQNRNEKIKTVLNLIDFDENLLNRDPQTLSSGEKRKLAIASVLIYEPELILMDEPLIALDYENKKNLIKLIRKLKKDLKKTIIIATNDSELLHQISDYIYVLDRGKVILKGTKYEVFKYKDSLINSNISLPKVIEFSNYVKEVKQIDLGYRDDINDLIKDVYRYAK